MQKFYLIPIIFIISCNSNNNSVHNSKNDSSNISFIGIVNKWDKANNEKDIAELSAMYASQINFYGSSDDKNISISKKQHYFQTHPDMYQQIKGNISVDTISDSKFKCSFVKSVTVNGKTTDYPSYLIFDKLNGKFLITTEGDQTTDNNLNKKQDAVNAFKSCEDVVIAIAKSSPKLKRK